ncbi:MAG: ThiF family adenylyltransferase [Chloroflexi bacterium]|nr:ThiF family adenylyltransferase [Chloroflexota bacterium]
MYYRIDSSPTTGSSLAVRYQWEATIVVVGCGGTGSFLAEAICRLLIGRKAQLYLVDMDRVEEHNVGRQSFDRGDVGRFKAQVLAERLSRRFEREVGYSILPYDRALHSQVFSGEPSRLNLLVGCVDNAAARRDIAATLDQPVMGYAYPCNAGAIWWLDCGNGRNSGQVLLGNMTQPEQLRGAFLPQLGICRALPAPSLQRSDLLEAPPRLEPRPDCAEAVAAADQGPTINQTVAAVAVTYAEKLMASTCSWMATYLDLDDGLLHCVAAEPKTVASLLGLHPNAVVRSNGKSTILSVTDLTPGSSGEPPN